MSEANAIQAVDVSIVNLRKSFKHRNNPVAPVSSLDLPLQLLPWKAQHGDQRLETSPTPSFGSPSCDLVNN
jgi:hypothetical protein